MFQLGDDALHEVEQGVFMRIAVKLVDHVVSRVYQTVGIQLSVDFNQPLYVPADTLSYGKDKRFSLTFLSGRHHRAAFIPLGGKNLILCQKLSHFPLVDDLIVDRALVVSDSRGPELYFY